MSSSRHQNNVISRNSLCALVFIFLSTLGLGCEKQQAADRAEKTVDYLEKLSDDIQEAIPSRKESWEEIKKIRQLEYQILTIAQHTPAGEIASRLSAAGKERWDCFHIEKTTVVLSDVPEEQFLVFCKRLMDTPLRYLPGISGGVLPGGIPGG